MIHKEDLNWRQSSWHAQQQFSVQLDKWSSHPWDVNLLTSLRGGGSLQIALESGFGGKN